MQQTFNLVPCHHLQVGFLSLELQSVSSNLSHDTSWDVYSETNTAVNINYKGQERFACQFLSNFLLHIHCYALLLLGVTQHCTAVGGWVLPIFSHPCLRIIQTVPWLRHIHSYMTSHMATSIICFLPNEEQVLYHALCNFTTLKSTVSQFKTTQWVTICVFDMLRFSQITSSVWQLLPASCYSVIVQSCTSFNYIRVFGTNVWKSILLDCNFVLQQQIKS